jgi:glutamate--cysteine ligase
MDRRLALRLRRLLNTKQDHLVQHGQKGLEREALRVTQEGTIAQTPHPSELGAALTHPLITTDYSEALLEFITAPREDLAIALDCLYQAHLYVQHVLSDELLWATSMPCKIQDEISIPIANYGRSNIGMMKHIYRRGLGYRYGRAMQAIAGVHFNYSLRDEFWPVFQEQEQDVHPLGVFISNAYFGLIRNLQRFGWLPIYLFGASPALCKSFFGARPSDFLQFDERTYFGPHATSLRMSDIGYHNKNPAGLTISYDNLETYLSSLTQALHTPHPDYEAIAIMSDGEYHQLNANLLQIEDEYYSTMRPKRVPLPGERPSEALRRRGVKYVELRSLDVDPFSVIGVNNPQLYFLEAFLVFCLLHESPPITDDERQVIEHNQGVVARSGRAPGLKLQFNEQPRSLMTWANEILEEMSGICEILDRGLETKPYCDALDWQIQSIRDPERTPSFRMLDEMRHHKESFFEFAMRRTKQQQDHFRVQPLSDQQLHRFREQAQQSFMDQKVLEDADELTFDEFLRHYLGQS